MKISSQNVHAEPLETQAAQLDLGFYPIGRIANCFKNIPKLCVCLCKPGPCFRAQRLYGSQPTGGPCQSGQARLCCSNKYAHSLELQSLLSGTLCVPDGSAETQLLVGTQAWGLKEQPPAQLLLFPVAKRKRALRGFPQAIKCSALEGSHITV